VREACRDLPVGDPVSSSEGWDDAVRALEPYLTLLLREVSPFWKHESLDGVYCEFASKTGPLEVELWGQCILITDQTLTPYHLELRVAQEADEIEWLECRLGEVRDGKLVRVPYNEMRFFKHPISGHVRQIQWQFQVGFGSRESS